MKFAEKFMLVPYNQSAAPIAETNPIEDELSKLDSQMSSILNNKKIDISQKIKLYSQTLQDYKLQESNQLGINDATDDADDDDVLPLFNDDPKYEKVNQINKDKILAIIKDYEKQKRRKTVIQSKVKQVKRKYAKRQKEEEEEKEQYEDAVSTKE